MVGKLKPCPCCGDPLPGMVRDRHSAYVACSTFGCWLSGPVAETEEGAARKWNALAGAAEEVERLRKEVDWLALVLANVGCGVPLTEYIGEGVNGMSPPAPEHWREAARRAVEGAVEGETRKEGENE